MCQDQQPVEDMGSSFHGKIFETEDSPVHEFCSWNWPFRNCVLPSGGGHLHRLSLSTECLDGEGITCFLMFVYLHGECGESHTVDNICEPPKWRGGT